MDEAARSWKMKKYHIIVGQNIRLGEKKNGGLKRAAKKTKNHKSSPDQNRTRAPQKLWYTD